MNLYEVETQQDADDPPGYQTPYARVGPAIGAAGLGLSVYELSLGNSVCPYHYEVPEEEWLFVLSGRPTLRDPDGEHELEPGDVVCFLQGPEGAHKVTNHHEEPVRIAILSTLAKAGYAVYPDSNKLNAFPIRKILRLEAAVDYWDRELGQAAETTE